VGKKSVGERVCEPVLFLQWKSFQIQGFDFFFFTDREHLTIMNLQFLVLNIKQYLIKGVQLKVI